MRVWVAGGTSGIGAAVVKKINVINAHHSAIGTGINDYNVRTLDCHHEPIACDALVYSVGINKLNWAAHQGADEMLDMMNVNVVGLLRCIHFAKITPESEKPIVVVGSDAAWRPMRTSVAYCASKAALHAMVGVLAREGYWINAVAPGMTEGTKMTEYIDKRVPEVRGWTDEQAREYELSQSVIGRRVTVEEVADTIRWLLFRSPRALTGTIVPVNGGR